METTICKGNSLGCLFQPSTNKFADFRDSWLIEVEGFGYWGPYKTKKSAQSLLDTNPDFNSFDRDSFFRKAKTTYFRIESVKDLRNFIDNISDIDDNQSIENHYLGSWFSGFTVIENRIIAETYS